MWLHRSHFGVVFSKYNNIKSIGLLLLLILNFLIFISNNINARKLDIICDVFLRNRQLYDFPTPPEVQTTTLIDKTRIILRNYVHATLGSCYSVHVDLGEDCLYRELIHPIHRYHLCKSAPHASTLLHPIKGVEAQPLLHSEVSYQDVDGSSHHIKCEFGNGVLVL